MYTCKYVVIRSEEVWRSKDRKSLMCVCMSVERVEVPGDGWWVVVETGLIPATRCQGNPQQETPLQRQCRCISVTYTER